MILPPNYVNVPSAVIYSGLSPAYRDTYIQLRGLAWKSKYKETPPVTFADLAKLFGKSSSTVYEHVRFLREHSWLQFRNAEGSAYIFSFPVVSGHPGNSESQEDVSINSETPINILPDENQPINNLEIEQSNIPENRNSFSRKLQGEGKKRDPTLSHPAVIDYRSFVHLTPNAVQRRMIIDTVNDLDFWRSTIEHWLEHGWRPTNIAGMLDSYRNGGKAGCINCNRDSQRQTSAKASLADIDEVFTRLAHGNK